ncbi:hypothetical protein ACI2LF_38215 [Kribbella sp. NPDC020789]
MIDEQLLLDRLTDAAAAQDDLLPRALADDLAAGRRRLRRRRFLTGGTALVAAGVVAIATLGVSGILKDNAQTEPPVATHQAPAVKTEPADFDKLMKGLMFKHFDPARKHLDFSVGPFEIDPAVGHLGTSRKVGWNVAGDKGQGMFLVQLNRSLKAAENTCGSFHEYDPQPLKCHPVTLSNGRPAMLGRKDGIAEFSYVQPDGEFVYVAVDRLFGNNTTIPLKSMNITDEQLYAFATDPALNLPPLTADQQAEEAKLKDFAPTPAQAEAVVLAKLGGTLTRQYLEDRPGELYITGKWAKGGVRATIDISADASILASECKDQLSVPSCVPVTLPNGAQGGYHEGARTYQGGPMYVMGATYKQPDGDLSAIRVLYPGKKRPAGAITKEQILALVSDPALDK